MEAFEYLLKCGAETEFRDLRSPSVAEHIDEVIGDYERLNDTAKTKVLYRMKRLLQSYRENSSDNPTE